MYISNNFAIELFICFDRWASGHACGLMEFAEIAAWGNGYFEYEHTERAKAVDA